MSQPILSIDSKNSAPTIANLLPCRIQHTGPVTALKSHWNPEKGQDGTTAVYFRGRKLLGKPTPLPSDYRGIVAERHPDPSATHPLPSGATATEPVSLDDDDNASSGNSTATLQVTGQFDELIVWSHEGLADAASDPYLRSMAEWIAVAERIHAVLEPET